MTDTSSTFLNKNEFYNQNYVYLRTPSYLLSNSPTIVLGHKECRICRFCGKSEPQVTFKLKAHAIPECLGNRTLFANFECDQCNRYFGEGIENHLGNWSIVTRVVAGIRGKKRIPKIRRADSQSGLTVTRKPEGLVYTEFGDASIVDFDEANGRATLSAEKYTYTPIMALKSLVRIAIMLLPDDEIDYFSETISWIRDAEHSKKFFSKCPVVKTLIPGPNWNQLIIPRLIRRKPCSDGFPYAFLILGFANHLFQVWLPCRTKDESIWNKALEIPPLIPMRLPNSTRYGSPVIRNIDLNGVEPVKGESESHTLSFETFETQE